MTDLEKEFNLYMGTPWRQIALAQAMENYVFGECDGEGKLQEYRDLLDTGQDSASLRKKLIASVEILEKVYSLPDFEGYMMKGHIVKTKEFLTSK